MGDRESKPKLESPVSRGGGSVVVGSGGAVGRTCQKCDGFLAGRAPLFEKRPVVQLPRGKMNGYSDSGGFLVAAAFSALHFARGSRGSGTDCLRVCCFGGDLPSAFMMRFG